MRAQGSASGPSTAAPGGGSPGQGGVGSTTSASAGGGGAGGGGANVKCDPTYPKCEKCAPDSAATTKKKRAACAKTWGDVKGQLVGNNCGYEVGSSRTAKWTDASCVVEEKACIPPKGSTEKPIYETCSNPKPCETQSPGWKCSVCFLVQDDGGDQNLAPGLAPAPGVQTCDATALWTRTLTSSSVVALVALLLA